jgi:hypothetical protein
MKAQLQCRKITASEQVGAIAIRAASGLDNEPGTNLDWRRDIEQGKEVLQ